MARSSDAADTVVAVRRFVEDEVQPAASALEHADAYPHTLVARMRELGVKDEHGLQSYYITRMEKFLSNFFVNAVFKQTSGQ